MIKLTRLNGKEYFINPHLIEFIEETPDTVITLTTGRKTVVEEDADHVVDQIIAYRIQTAARLPTTIKASEEA